MSLTINSGDATTTTTAVTLALTATAYITQMRLADAPEDLKNKPFQPFASTLAYTLPTGNGPHKVYVQFGTATGDIIPMYFGNIDLQAPLPTPSPTPTSTPTPSPTP